MSSPPHRPIGRHQQRVAIQPTTRNPEARRPARTPYGTGPLKLASPAPSARVVPDADSRRAVTRRRAVLTGPQERGKRCRIERAHAHLVPYRGNRRAWYLGLTKAFYQTALSAVCGRS